MSTATFGRLVAAYNNAGVQNIVAETADAPREDFDRVMTIKLRGVWSCSKFELRQMCKQGNSAIVNGSSLGWWALPGVEPITPPSTESSGSRRALLSVRVNGHSKAAPRPGSASDRCFGKAPLAKPGT